MKSQLVDCVTPYDPKGTRFYSGSRGQQMILVSEGPWKDWLCYMHPDGQWVSLRKATAADLHELAAAMSAVIHQ